MEKSISVLEDPYFERRLNDAIKNNSDFNRVMIYGFALISLLYSVAIFDWGVMVFALALISSIKGYFVVLIFRFKRSLKKYRESFS